MHRHDRESSAPKKIAVASIRRSSVNQEGNNSFEIQKMAIKEYAEKHGYFLPDEFIFFDDAVSAYKTKASKRVGLNKMKGVVLTQDISGIIFYDFSRIDRRIYSFVSEFYNEVVLKKPHLKFYSTTKENEWTPSDLDVKFQLIFANAESNEKSRRAIDAQKKDLQSKSRPGSAVPYGYNQVNKELEINDEEAPIVLLIFYLASWGHSVQKIAAILNEAGLSSSKLKLWQPSTINNILKNPVYSGRFSWKFKRKHSNFDQEVSLSSELIVPPVLYDLIEINRSFKQKYNKLDTPFLFGSLLCCKSCRSTLTHRNCSTQKNGVKYNYMKYYCPNCLYEIDTDQLNAKLLAYISKQLSASIKINSSTVKNQINASLIALKRFKESLLVKERLVLANENAISSNQEKSLANLFERVKKRLRQQIAEIDQMVVEKELSINPLNINVFLESFQDIDILSLSNTEQRLLLLYFVQEIEIVHKGDGAFNFSIQFKLNPFSLLSNTAG
jgi:site-specific DNA recombinase